MSTAFPPQLRNNSWPLTPTQSPANQIKAIAIIDGVPDWYHFADETIDAGA